MVTPPQQLSDAEDLVDRVVEYLHTLCPETRRHDAAVLKDALRAEFAGLRAYLRKRPHSQQLARDVLRLFNGRNATQIARQLNISRATVYRLLKQPGPAPTAPK